MVYIVSCRCGPAHNASGTLSVLAWSKQSYLAQFRPTWLNAVEKGALGSIWSYGTIMQMTCTCGTATYHADALLHMSAVAA